MSNKSIDYTCRVGYNVLRTELGQPNIVGKFDGRVPASGSAIGGEMLNWRTVIRRGGNATTSFSASYYKPTPIQIHADCVINFDKSVPWRQLTTCDYWGTPNGSFSTPAIGSQHADAIARADTLARQQFLKKYRAARTAFQSGVFFGELLETVRMIKSPAKALRQGINDYYRTVKKRVRKSKNRRQASKIIGETWLEYAFGWRPFIRDVQDAVKLGCALPEKYMQPITKFSNIEWKSEPERTINGSPTISWPYWWETRQHSNQAMVVYRGAAAATMNIPDFPEQLGVSWSNVLPTVWELIPYSFLVDYFSNIGEVIEGISTGTIGLAWGARAYIQSSTTHMSTQIDRASLKVAVGHDNFSCFVSGAGVCGQRKKVDRTPITQISFGLSDLQFELPGARSLKWLNIAALANMRR